MALSKAQKRENEQRAQRGRDALDAHMVSTGYKDRTAALRDLLADLMHTAYADCEVEPFDEALNAARVFFDDEITGRD